MNTRQARLARTCVPPAMFGNSRHGQFKTWSEWSEFNLHLYTINVLILTEMFYLKLVHFFILWDPSAVVPALVSITGSEIHTIQVIGNRWVVAHIHSRLQLRSSQVNHLHHMVIYTAKSWVCTVVVALISITWLWIYLHFTWSKS